MEYISSTTNNQAVIQYTPVFDKYAICEIKAKVDLTDSKKISNRKS